MASAGHCLDEKAKKRSLLRVLREGFATTAKVIRAMDMNFTKALSELVVEEGSGDVELSTDDSSATAMATVHHGKHRCTHFGREGHTMDRCFHNSASKWYKKEIKYDFGKGNKHRNMMNSSTASNKNMQNSENDDELANVAMMSKSALRGEVEPTTRMKEKWMIDSASTSHMCNDPAKFETLQKEPHHPVEVGERQLVHVSGIGTVRSTFVVDGRKQKFTMKSVLYVPTMICNLRSVSKARRAGFRVTFDGDEESTGYCEILRKGSAKVYLKGIERPEGLYEAQFAPDMIDNEFVSKKKKKEVWHKRLAHVSSNVIAKTLPIVDGLDIKTIRMTSESKCEDCELGMSCCKP